MRNEKLESALSTWFIYSFVCIECSLYVSCPFELSHLANSKSASASRFVNRQLSVKLAIDDRASGTKYFYRGALHIGVSYSLSLYFSFFLYSFRSHVIGAGYHLTCSVFLCVIRSLAYSSCRQKFYTAITNARTAILRYGY